MLDRRFDAGSDRSEYRSGVTRARTSARDRARLLDLAIAAVLGIAIAVSNLDKPPTIALLMGSAAIPLLWRRTRPVPSSVATGVVLAGILALAPMDISHPLFLMALSLVAAYSVAAHESRLSWAAAGGVVVTAGMTFDVILYGPGGTDDAVWPFRVVEVAVAWLVGRALHRSGRLVSALDLRAGQLAVDQERRAAAAVAEERARLARELHDVVAHNVSLIVVQAGAAEQVVHATPERAVEPLQNIQLIGRQTIDELRRLLGILRDHDDALATAPQPTLAQIDTLVEQVRRAGTAVTVEHEGELRVPASIDLSAYRILQEGLTNVVKHAEATAARVLIRSNGSGLLLEVTDDGRGSNGSRGNGLGLVGMRERVALLGGELETTDRPGGGFQLRAWLPLNRHIP